MNIQRAGLRDVPALAWVAARAFAAESGRAGVRRRALGVHLMHFYNLGALALRGRLWHWDRVAVIAIGVDKQVPRWVWAACILPVVAGLLGLAAWIPTLDSLGLNILSIILIVMLAALLPAAIASIKELHPWRDSRNAAAIRLWKRGLKGRPVYSVFYLAMYPQTGEGLTFARAVLERVVPSHAAICTVARSDRHRLIYARCGFNQLATVNGTPTFAMCYLGSEQ